VAEEPVADVSGAVAAFADASGLHLPLAATLNAARVLEAAARMLRVSHDELSRMALRAPPGADGLVLIPYLEGERTPNRPDAAGALHGLRLGNSTPEHVARAAVEGMMCGLADAVDAVRCLGTPIEQTILVGGAARSPAVRLIASAVLGLPVTVPSPEEYVARGAARQAAWVHSGSPEPPHWTLPDVEAVTVEATTQVRRQYAGVRELTAVRAR
jgi:xylulokinase